MVMSSGFVAQTATEYFGTVSVAMVTPFDNQGELDLAAARRLASHLVSNGIDSLVLSGTTGESPTTSLSEKLDLLTAVKAEVGDKAKLVVGCSTYDTAQSVRITEAVTAAGADALLAVTPYYSKPSQEGVYQHLKAIADVSELPICLYDIPPRAGIGLSPDTIKRLAELPTVHALKDAKGDIAQATHLIAETGLGWYSGDDPLNLPWLSIGASGFISVIGHLAPQQLRDMFTAFAAGDLATARALNTQIAPLVSAQGRLGGACLAKAGLALQGIAVGAPRLPNVAPDAAAVEQLRADMISAGVL